jgi:hypothetical protein
MNLQELTQHTLNAFPTAFITGSKVFFPRQTPADIDIVIAVNEKVLNRYDPFMRYIKEQHEVETGDYFVSDKIYPSELPKSPWEFCGKGPYVNLIHVSPIDWHCWYHGTQMMLKLPRIPEDKIVRHAIFESLRATIKSTLYAQQTTMESIPDRHYDFGDIMSGDNQW